MELKGKNPHLVPLEYHVDYWDYLGWKDPLAAGEYTLRQKYLAQMGRERQVYTPGFFLNGKPSRPRAPTGIKQLNQVATTTLTLNFKGSLWNGALESTLKWGGLAKNIPAQFRVAFFQNHFKIPVTSGENSGKILTHDRVVRWTLGPYPLNGENGEFFQQFRLPVKLNKKPWGVVLFVENPKTGGILQVLEINPEKIFR